MHRRLFFGVSAGGWYQARPRSVVRLCDGRVRCADHDRARRRCSRAAANHPDCTAWALVAQIFYLQGWPIPFGVGERIGKQNGARGADGNSHHQPACRPVGPASSSMCPKRVSIVDKTAWPSVTESCATQSFGSRRVKTPGPTFPTRWASDPAYWIKRQGLVVPGCLRCLSFDGALSLAPELSWAGSYTNPPAPVNNYSQIYFVPGQPGFGWVPHPLRGWGKD